MARPKSVDDEQILRAARDVFLTRGITATTAEIARRACVSSGSIFRRWKTKEELFRAAIVPHLADPAWLATLAAGRGEPRTTLLRAADQALGYFRWASPLLMMSWANADVVPIKIPAADMLRTLKYLSDWLATYLPPRSPPADPEVTARVFIGAIHGYAMSEIFRPPPSHERVAREQFLKGLIDIVWPLSSDRRQR